MMARSTRGSNQRPDTLMQDRTSAVDQSSLATHGRTIHWVISRQSVLLGLCPLYPQKADIDTTALQLGFPRFESSPHAGDRRGPRYFRRQLLANAAIAA